MVSDSQLPDWLDRAVGSPASVFRHPEEVLNTPELTKEQKIRILRSWEYDAAELEVAQEEGMPGESNGLLERVLLALSQLTHGAGTALVSSSKQHGLISPTGAESE